MKIFCLSKDAVKKKVSHRCGKKFRKHLSYNGHLYYVKNCFNPGKTKKKKKKIEKEDELKI